MMKTEKSTSREIMEWGVAFLLATVFAFLLHQFVFAPVLVDGESMMPTLHDQNKMIVNKMAYCFSDPDRFDIVVFHATSEKDYIKRVIGVPGDTLEYKDDELYINNQQVDEPYLDQYKSELTGGNLTADFTLEDVTRKLTIPEDKYFVMGDNRRKSEDSRMIGLVDEDQIVGRANLVFWPLSDFGLTE